MNLRGGGATYNQAPSSVLAESNGIMRHPEPKAKDPIKTEVDSSVASLLQNDEQGARRFFGLCLQNDKTHCDEPISSDQSDGNTQNQKCRDSAVNNNCRQGKPQRRVLSERSEFTRQNAESSKLLENGACGWFASLCHQSDRCPRRTKQKPEVDSSVASLLQNDKAAQGDSSGIRPQNDIKKDVILSQRRRIHLKHNWSLHSVQNDMKKSKHAAFTMAEVLITLGLIGVVAALTIPNLTKRYEEKAIITKYKKVYSVLANAYNLAMMESGPPDSWILEDEADLLKILEPHLNVVEKCYYKKGCTSQGSFVSLSGEHRWGELNDMEIYPKIRLNGGFSLMILDPVHQGCKYDQENIDDDGNPYTTTIYECGIIYAVVTNNSNPKNKNYFGKDHFVFAATNKGIFPVGYNRTEEYVKKFCKKKNQNATTGNGGTCGEWIIRYDNMDYFYGSKD